MNTPVEHVMTRKIFGVPVGTTLKAARQLMDEKRIRHLPVIDAQEVVVGILSQRDLQVSSNSDESLVELSMSYPVQFVEKDTPLKNAIFQMLQSKISCLLVGDTDGSAIGVLTTDDLLWYLAHLLSEQNNQSFSILNVNARQTVGEVAEKLSLMGL